MRQVRIVVGVAVVVALAWGIMGAALAGFNSCQILGWLGVGTYSGSSLSSAHAQKVQQAINALAAAGHTDQANNLQKALDRGDICKENNADVCGVANTGNDTAACNAEINISCAYLDGPVDVLASVLLHEILHFMITGVPPGEEHCMIYWWEYVWLTNQQANHAAGSPTYNAIQAEIDDILRKYPSFSTWTGPGYPPYTATTTNSLQNRKILELYSDRGIMYFTDGSSALYYRKWSTTTTETLTAGSLTLSANRILDIRSYVTASGANVVVATGTNSAGTDGAVYTITDSNGDKLVDTVTTIVGFGSGLVRPNGVTWVDRVSATTRWFVLDSCQGKIWKLADSNSDEIPDGLGTVYANTDLCPEIAVAKGICRTGVLSGMHANGTTYVAVTSHFTAEREVEWGGWWISLHDSDGNGVADEQSGKQYYTNQNEFNPLYRAGAGHNEDYVMVKAPGGHTVQVLAYNAGTGEYDIVRGSGSVPSGDVYATTTLSTAFQQGDTFKLKDTTTGKLSPVTTVTQPKPVITGLTPTKGPDTGGTTVTIQGVNFGSSAPTVYFGSATATVVEHSETTLIVTTPSMGNGTNIQAVRVVKSGGIEAKNWFFLAQD